MLKLLKFLKPFSLPILMVLVLIFLQALSELYLPTLMSDIVDIGIVNGDTTYIIRVGGFMLLVTAMGTVCSIGASFLTAKVAMGFGRNLRTKVFSHAENFSLQEFDKIGTASLIVRTTNDIAQVQHVLTIMLRMMISAPLMCIGGIIMAVSKDPKLSLILVGIIPVLALTIFTITSKGMPLFKAIQVKLDRLNLVLREGLTGIRVIRSFNRMDFEQDRFQKANYDLTGTTIKVNKIMAAMMPMMMLLLNFSTIAIIWFGSIRIDQGNLQVGDLMAFIQYAMQILFSLMMLSMMFVMIPRASVSATRINEVLDMEHQIKEPEHVVQGNSQRGFIEFEKVSFSYPGAEMPALSNISFCARPGEVTAIIGGTGSGKSTLISLIPRFFDVDGGSIQVDGVDVRQMPQETLRAQIGFVPQRTVLFTGTIAENIRYGKEDASAEEVRQAANIAQASEFILGLKDGFDSLIAQGGSNLSGGQKQRLSIARALVRRPKIYIFDDSFSALDFKTEAKLRSDLKQVTTNTTMLVVAQRVSSIMDADQIIVLDEGQIAGIGKHRELMQNCQVYQEIVASQLSEEEVA
ncbi:ABC transporter ATP-binding protein [Desulfotomaculum defluvii]